MTKQERSRFFKNPYYRGGALAAAFVFAMGHWAYWQIAAAAPEGTKRRFFIAAVALASTATLIAALMGRRYQRRLDRLTQRDRTKNLSSLRAPKDELSQLDLHVSGMARDLEERVEQLEREKSRMAAMLGSMQEGLIIIGEDKKILLMNPAAGTILGVAPDRAAGCSLLQIARNGDLESLAGEALRSGSSVSKEIRFFKPEELFLRVNAAPYRVAAGELQAALVLHDVTELHQLENVRREFVANVSHELKTPLTSLQGFIETMLAGAWQKPEHAKRFLGMMEEDARRLSRLIHDLLDLSKIEAQEQPDRREPLDLAALANSALSGLATQIRQKKLTVINEIMSSDPKAPGDPGQIDQVFVNLLENAVKFTPEGGSIRIHSSIAAGFARVEITDTGSGIPEASLSRVFERFYRVDPARSREMGGTGLGLSIVKHIIEKHGGSVGVTSPGQGLGSTFFFSLPVPSAA